MTVNEKDRRAKRRVRSSELGYYLEKIAALHSDPKFGDPAFKDALSELARFLIERGERPLALPAAKSEQRKAEASHRAKARERFSDLPAQTIRKILEEDSMTKEELATLANARYGLGRSHLLRIPRDEVVSSIKSAMQHEESLSILSKEARRKGRTS